MTSWQKAEFEAILAVDRVALSDEHELTLTTHCDLASVLREQGDLVGAKTEFET